MSDDGEILASDTFETDFLNETVERFSNFLDKGGFVLPGKLEFNVKSVSEQRKDAYQEIVEYYNNPDNKYESDINLDF